MVVYRDNPVVIAHASGVRTGVPEIQHPRRNVLGVVTPRPVGLVSTAPRYFHQQVLGLKWTLGTEAPAPFPGDPVVPKKDLGVPVKH